MSQPRPWTRRVIPGALVAACFAAFPALAAELHVAPDGSGDYPTIQAAYDAAVSGDEVVLADGTFTGEGNRDIELGFRGITIRSVTGDPSRTIVDAESEAALVGWDESSPPPYELDRIVGLTLTGGGDLDLGGPVTFEDCWIVGNEAYWIVHVPTGGEVVFRRCLVVGNRSTGATLVGYLCDVRLEDSVIAGNASDDDRASAIISGEAGGIWIERSVVAGNCSSVPGVPQVGFGESLPGFVRVTCSVVEPGALHEDVQE